MKVLLQARGDGSAELLLYDAIGVPGISAKEVVESLKRASELASITVRINSPGGDVFDGVAIYHALRRHAAKVTVEVDGMAASAASLIAMAGDEIVMAEGALLMVHNPWALAIGEAVELRDVADRLDKLRDSFVAIYAQRSGAKPEEIQDAMDRETWMSADEAIAFGFADSKTASDATPQLAASADKLAQFHYRNLPRLPQPQPQPAVQGRAANRGDTEDEMKELLKFLGVATEAEAAEKIRALTESAQRNQTLEAILGHTGDAAIGAARGLVTAAAAAEALKSENKDLKGAQSKAKFEALKARGIEERKLTPATAKHYKDRYNKAVEAKDGSPDAVADELEGFLAVAPVVVPASAHKQPSVGGTGDTLTHSGKTFADLKPMERHALKKDDPDLYEAMRAQVYGD